MAKHSWWRRLIGVGPIPVSEREPSWVFDSTKDISHHPYFLGDVSRLVWRAYMYRLSRVGRWALVASVFLFLSAANTPEIELYVPAVYLFALWIAALLALKVVKPRVDLRAQHTERICAGETIPVEVEVTQLGRVPAVDLYVLPHNLPPAIDAVEPEGAHLPVLRRGATARARLHLRCRKRGVHTLYGYRVETEYPFGLVRAYAVKHAPRQILVYPRFERLTRLAVPTGLRYQPGGVAMASTLGESFEFIGDREYREGDNIRDIDWRATARLGQPIVREYREEFFHRVAVILDTYVPRRGGQAQAAAFERAVSVTAAISDYMARQDYLVDLFAAGPNLYHLTAGRSLAYIDQILDILAAVESGQQEPFDLLEPEILEYLAQITTIVCVFLDWNEARRAFVHRLSYQGAGIKVVVVREGTCTLDPMVEDVAASFAVLTPADVDRGVGEL